MPACAVASCSNHNMTKTGASTTYHRFPKDASLRKLWIDACGRKDEFNVLNARICSEHFCETDFVKDLRGELLQKRHRMEELIESACPSLKNPELVTNASNSEQGTQLFQNRKRKHKIQAQTVQSGVQEQTESILPDVAAINLDIVKKEPIDYTEESVASPAQNIPSSSACMLSLKSEPNDDCVDGSTVPVTPDDTSLPTTSAYIIESSSTSIPYAFTNNAEPPAKRPNISQNPFTSNTETKDVFSAFGEFVAAKLRNFTGRRLQVEAQHRITNMLFEMEMEDLNGDSLPVISKISS